MTATTNKDVPMKLWGRDVVIPKGTVVIHPKNSVEYAVESAGLLVKLTGNQNDPFYGYAWIKPEDVDA